MDNRADEWSDCSIYEDVAKQKIIPNNDNAKVLFHDDDNLGSDPVMPQIGDPFKVFCSLHMQFYHVTLAEIVDIGNTVISFDDGDTENSTISEESCDSRLRLEHHTFAISRLFRVIRWHFLTLC